MYCRRSLLNRTVVCPARRTIRTKYYPMPSGIRWSLADLNKVAGSAEKADALNTMEGFSCIAQQAKGEMAICKYISYRKKAE